MKKNLLLLSLAVMAWAVTATWAAEDTDPFADVQIEVTSLTSGIHMLEGSGGNLAACTGPDGVLLIDDQYAPLSDKIKSALADLDSGPVKFVFNTHWHGDHTGGNENFGETGSLIISHDNVRRRLTSEQFTAIWDRTTPPSPAGAWPVITFTDSLTFHFNDQTIVAFHVPNAHTDGDGLLHFTEANIIHAGDTVFFGLYPYIDTSAGGNIDGMIAAVKTILALCDAETRVIPGHGPLVGPRELETYLAMLTGVRAAVAEQMEGGADLAAVQAADPAGPWDEDWGQEWLTSDQFVQMVYESLAVH